MPSINGYYSNTSNLSRNPVNTGSKIDSLMNRIEQVLTKIFAYLFGDSNLQRSLPPMRNELISAQLSASQEIVNPQALRDAEALPLLDLLLTKLKAHDFIVKYCSAKRIQPENLRGIELLLCIQTLKGLYNAAKEKAKENGTLSTEDEKEIGASFDALFQVQTGLLYDQRLRLTINTALSSVPLPSQRRPVSSPVRSSI